MAEFPKGNLPKGLIKFQSRSFRRLSNNLFPKDNYLVQEHVTFRFITFGSKMGFD